MTEIDEIDRDHSAAVIVSILPRRYFSVFADRIEVEVRSSFAQRVC